MKGFLFFGMRTKFGGNYIGNYIEDDINSLVKIVINCKVDVLFSHRIHFLTTYCPV